MSERGREREHAVIVSQTPALSFPRKRESSFIALLQGALGLGRKDGNTGSFHKDGWIPAFAGMTGWGVRAAKPRTAWSEWEGSGPHCVREECLNPHEFLKLCFILRLRLRVRREKR